MKTHEFIKLTGLIKQLHNVERERNQISTPQIFTKPQRHR